MTLVVMVVLVLVLAMTRPIIIFHPCFSLASNALQWGGGMRG